MVANVDGLPMPNASMDFTMLASLYRAGAFVECLCKEGATDVNLRPSLSFARA